MEAETRKKIEETVLKILKKSNLKEDTEQKIRSAASEELKIDLSSMESKILVRSVVEAFLVSPKGVVQEHPKQEKRLPKKINKEVDDGVERVICELSKRKRVAVRGYEGRNVVTFREFYVQKGMELPSARGISLTSQQWSTFRSSIPAIEEAVKKMKTSSRLQTVDINEETTSAAAGSVFVAGLVPLEIKRFNGKKYQAWANQMELFLKQLNIAYVLTEPCPSSVKLEEDASCRNEGGAAAKLKWVNDDYICHRNILSSLSDSLLCKYSSPKRESAKQLWEELKLAYLCEEMYGTKILQVKKYLEFEIVDDRRVSVREQVEELNCLADAIVASGVTVEEFFHVSVIISKLPPSWKDFCIKFIMHNFLSFRVLMDSIRAAEEAQQHVSSSISKSNNPTTSNSSGGGGAVALPRSA